MKIRDAKYLAQDHTANKGEREFKPTWANANTTFFFLQSILG